MPHEIRKKSSRQSIFTPVWTWKRTNEPKVTRRKELIKIREEINELETKKTREMSNETKSWVLWKDKFDKSLSTFTKKKRESTQKNEIINEREVTSDTTEIPKIMRPLWTIICHQI